MSWESLGINGEETVKLSFKSLKLHESFTSVGTLIYQRFPAMFSFFVNGSINVENKERTSSPHFHAMFPHIEQSGIVSYLPSVMSKSPCKLRFWRVQSPQRAVGRVAEGAPLLREYGLTLIEGSNPSLPAIFPPENRRFHTVSRVSGSFPNTPRNWHSLATKCQHMQTSAIKVVQNPCNWFMEGSAW